MPRMSQLCTPDPPWRVSTFLSGRRGDRHERSGGIAPPPQQGADQGTLETFAASARHGPCRSRPLSASPNRKGSRLGQRSSDRRAMGRRGQGQDRRLAGRARRHGGALPGRSQCRPHARRGRPDLQAFAAPVRRGARYPVRHRQRRGARSLAPQGRGGAAGRTGCRDLARDPAHRRYLPADPAAPPRTRRPARGRERRGQDRHHAARHRTGL